MRKLLWIGSGLLFVGVGLGACGVNTENVCDYPGACGGDAGTDVKVDGSGDTGIDAPPGCDLAKDPKDSVACVADSVGVFVDATKGDDTAGDGSKLKPLKTIGTALGKVGNKPRIYVCEGTYAEDVVLDASHDGVSLYGGWKCADWSYSGGKPVVGKGTLALKVDSVTKAIVVADLEIRAADAAVAGTSSIGALVSTSTNVTFARAKLVAGRGKDASDPVLTPFTFPLPADLKGNNSIGTSGGVQNLKTCPGGATTKGGKGGDNGFPGDDGLPALGGGQAGTAGQCNAAGGGKDGTSASASPNADGAKALGVVDATGWKPGAGASGTNGGPGQGGGGGYGTGGDGAGGGGAGGCGGAGGLGGGGGGASVALVVVASGTSLNASELISSDAGKGGAGTAAQPGQTPGGGRGSDPNGFACQGGLGGAGGSGGAGGGGAGGISVGVLWKGAAAPTIDGSTTAKITVAATGGAKGTGGASPGNDGVAGVAQAVLEVK